MCAPSFIGARWTIRGARRLSARRVIPQPERPKRGRVRTWSVPQPILKRPAASAPLWIRNLPVFAKRCCTTGRWPPAPAPQCVPPPGLRLPCPPCRTKTSVRLRTAASCPAWPAPDRPCRAMRPCFFCCPKEKTARNRTGLWPIFLRKTGMPFRRDRPAPCFCPTIPCWTDAFWKCWKTGNCLRTCRSPPAAAKGLAQQMRPIQPPGSSMYPCG